MDKQIYVIQEKYDDGDAYIIGVADTVERTHEMINEYYGGEKIFVLSFDDVRDSGIEYITKIRVTESVDYQIFYNMTITVMSFSLNKI